MSDLAKRAVACKWRWMPGMATLEGARCVAAAVDGRQVWAWKDGSTARVGNVLSLPDLDDPATLGCFEHGLLPAVGFSEAHVTVSIGLIGTLYMVVYRPDPISFPTRWLEASEKYATTRAAALVAALEAAP